MPASLTSMLQLFKYEALESIIDIKVARHPHFGYKTNVDFVLGVILLFYELFSLNSTESMYRQKLECADPGTILTTFGFW